MSIITVTAGTAQNVQTDRATLAVPTCAIGDVLMAVMSVPGNRTVATPPTGWTQKLATVSSGGVSSTDVLVYVYTRTADATDAAGGVSYQWIWNLASTRSWGVILRCQNVDPANPFAVTGQNSGGATASTTITGIAATSPLSGRLIAIHGINPNNAGTPTITPDVALTQVIQGGNQNDAVSISTLDDQTSPLAYNATSSLTGRWISQTIVLWPLGARPKGTGVWGSIGHSGGSEFSPPYTAGSRLTWQPPSTAGYTVVHVSNANRNPTLDPNTDYLIVCDSPITADGGLVLDGGRNIVMIGGEIDFRGKALNRTASQMRGLLIQHIRGSAHIEGVLFRGDPHSQGRTVAVTGALGDAINVNDCGGTAKRATVTLQNIRIENARVDNLDQQNGTGSYGANTVHADCIQWYGPCDNTTLRVDKFSATTAYQGLFIQASNLSKAALDFRRMNIDAVTCRYDATTPDSGYIFYRSSGINYRATFRDVYMIGAPARPRNQLIWTPDPDIDAAVIEGAPPGGDFVPAGIAGMTYVSPGYLGVP